MSSQIEKGPGGPQGGSDLNVLHTERDMTVYVLTEPELDRIGDLNANAAGYSAMAAFFGGLWVDLYKDASLAQNIPAATQTALNFVQPLIAILALASAIAAIVFWIKRGRYQSRIKRDSKSKSRVRGEVRPASSGDDGA